MKRVFSLAVGLAIFAALAGSARAQRNPRGITRLSLKGSTLSVEYGRPALKGRSETDMLGKLKPGDFWRLGADKSTTLSAAGDLTFGDASVPRGEYSLWVQRTADGWKLVFNKQHGQWGTDHDPAQDFASAPLKESKAAKPAEMVTITLAKGGAGGVLTIEWGHLSLSTNFAAK